MPLVDGWPSDKLDHAEYISLYPNTLLGIQADHAFAVIVLPQRHDRSVEKLQISYVGDAATADKYAACRETVLKSWESGVSRGCICRRRHAGRTQLAGFRRRRIDTRAGRADTSFPSLGRERLRGVPRGHADQIAGASLISMAWSCSHGMRRSMPGSTSSR